MAIGLNPCFKHEGVDLHRPELAVHYWNLGGGRTPGRGGFRGGIRQLFVYNHDLTQ